MSQQFCIEKHMDTDTNDAPQKSVAIISNAIKAMPLRHCGEYVNQQKIILKGKNGENRDTNPWHLQG